MNSNVLFLLDEPARSSAMRLSSLFGNTDYKQSKVYTFTDLSETTIKDLCREEKCEWVVAMRSAATAMLHIQGYKKILISPVVTPTDVEDVTSSDADNTWGFFGGSSEEEASYEVFQCKYPNAVWYLGREHLQLENICKEVCEIIINSCNKELI